MIALRGLPLWSKCLVVLVFGATAYSLMQVAENSRLNYELSVCVNTVNSQPTCEFGSASNSIIPEGSVAVAFIAVATLAANVFAPPKLTHMRRAFVPRHFYLVVVWYILSSALTLVPLVYTIYLLVQQASFTGQDLSTLSPSTMLSNLGGDAPYNPCNPANYYCLSITPGLLAGFGYLFAGATAFWVAWLIMDNTAHCILDGSFEEEHPMEGAYFSAAQSAELDQDLTKPGAMYPMS